MSHEGYHEPYKLLPETVRDVHRALISLAEELEAVDWYYQRAALTTDPELQAVILHNAHEEIEHAMMVLEWLRRQDKVFDTAMHRYLFRDGSITSTEAAAKKGEAQSVATVRAPIHATLGSLREGNER